ncbi:MAG: large repetitive protein, partial [Mycobacterium sp.]|nr:large repetitive protein [Mycobacterium sp.]
MGTSKHTRRVGVLAVAFGLGVAAMSHPGIAAADPTAEPSPGASKVESPVPGGPGSKTELGVVSPGGSTPLTGAGSVAARSGSDEQSDPGQAATTGSTEKTSKPAPGVVVRSSGGAQTANEHGRGRGHGHDTADTPQAEPEPAPAEDAAVATTPTEEQGVVASPEVTAATTAATTTTTEAEIAALDDAVKLASDPTSVGTKARQPKHLVLSEISEIPSLTASLRADSAAGIAEVAHGGIQIAVLGLETSTMAADVNTTAVRRDSTAPGEDASTRESLPIFTGVLAAALAPFVMPFPGSPVNQPTLWALLAWTRRQFERETTDGRPALVAYPRHTESVLTDPNADPPGAIVDRIDRVTGRVTGRVNVIDVTADERAGLTYALVEQVDRRLGVVAVNGTTGQWTFTPNQTARLAAQLSQDGGIATFS